MARACNPAIQSLRQEGVTFQASLQYTGRPWKRSVWRRRKRRKTKRKKAPDEETSGEPQSLFEDAWFP